MSDSDKKTVDPRFVALGPVDHMIAAGERQLLALGVPHEVLAKIMLQHSASIVSLIEPPAVRAQVMQRLISNYPEAVRVALMAASKTPGGVILPGPRLEEEVATGG